jgi:CubicO group peptidase (beta-lactamase class C family)
MRRTLGVLLFASALLAQTTVPDTPAGQVFTAWLAAFNSGDAERVRAFDAAHRRDTPPVQLTIDMRDRTGGFTLVRIEKSDASSIVALLQEKNSDTIARFDVTVNADTPPRIMSSGLRAIPRPADLAIARKTEAEAVAAVSARADELAKNDQFSGALLVARRGNVVLHKAWGRANRDTGAANTTETQFRVGSMNKMFTATAALQLVGAGKLSLDDPIGKHLTGYPNRDVATKVTIRHLLTHSGGTGDIFGPQFAANRLTLKEPADYLKLYGERALVHEPGAEFRYSNYGFMLLGAIVERASGLSYDDYVRTRIFEPAGMTSTGSRPEVDTLPGRSAGYMKRNGGWVSNAETLPWRGTPAGGGYSTVGDFLRFAQALEAGKLIPKALLAEASKIQLQQYGFGFAIQGQGSTRSYGHGGGAPGMNGDLRIFPELGYVVVALSNLDPPAAQRLVDYFVNRMPVTGG